MVPPLVELALDYYRRPIDYGHLADIEQPLPPELPKLLAELSSALSAARIEETARSLSTDAEELEAAARFFVRHALLNPAADHYRCLGVSRGSSAAEIRSNYQLLIRMFHPDRLEEVDEVDLAYSTRLNTAYRVLRDPSSRAAYDQGLPRRARSARRGNRPRYFRPQSSAAATARGKHRAARVGNPLKRPWLSSALLAVGALGGVYLATREPEHPTLRLTQPAAEVEAQHALPQYLRGLGSGPSPEQTSEQTSSTASRLQPVAPSVTASEHASIDARPQGLKASVAWPEETASPINVSNSPLPSLRVPTARDGEAGPITETRAAERTPGLHDAVGPLDPVVPAATLEPTKAAEVAEVPSGSLINKEQPVEARHAIDTELSVERRIEAVVQAALADTRPPKQPPAPKPEPSPRPSSVARDAPEPSRAPGAEQQRPPRPAAPPAPSPAEPATGPQQAAMAGTQMVERLEGAYRGGSAAAFAALFTSNARTTDGNGRALIQRQYQDLFRDSLEQSMSIRRIRWSRDGGGRITGQGQVSVSVHDRSSGWRRLSGSIRIALVEQGGRHFINGLFYDLK
jgi:curved DNA-binding protein CbpA